MPLSRPFLKGWLGEQPRTQLSILDVPDPQDAPFETGSLLVAPIRQTTPEELDGALVHALTHAWMASPRAWLSEGVASIHEHSVDRKNPHPLVAVRKLSNLLRPIAPRSRSWSRRVPGQSAGQPLDQAIAPIYYRTKAAYIFWMLRDLVGDPALSAALRAYDPAADLNLPSFRCPRGQVFVRGGRGPDALEKLLEHSGAESAGGHGDLTWFFADWVDADKGLPDIAIDSVFPSHTQGDNWLVAVNLSNAGYAAAEIPVTVSNTGTSVTQRVIIPARSKAVQRILIQGRPTQVQANDGAVPEVEATIHIKTITEMDTLPPVTPPAAR